MALYHIQQVEPTFRLFHFQKLVPPNKIRHATHFRGQKLGIFQGVAHKDESWRGMIVRSAARRMRLPGRHGGTHMQESQLHSTTIPQPRSNQPQPQPRLNHPSCRIQERFRHNHPTFVILQLRQQPQPNDARWTQERPFKALCRRNAVRFDDNKYLPLLFL